MSRTTETDSSAVPELRRSLVLAEGLELLNGPDGIPMVYVPQRRRYVRLSSLGQRVISLLREEKVTTGDGIVSELLRGREAVERNEEIERQVVQFLKQLWDSGVLAGAAAKRGWRRPEFRIPLWRSTAAPVSRMETAAAANASGRLLRISLFGIVFTAACYASIAGFHRLQVPFDRGGVQWAVLFLLLACHLTCHEASHALIASRFGCPIREAGIALLYYFIPAAYLDRTDAYRLPDFHRRAFIALAGPAFDTCGAALSAFLLTRAGAALQPTLTALLWAQILLFLNNLNPLLPTDGYHALEAGFHELNFRGRAFRFARSCLTGAELPAFLSAASVSRRAIYAIYALLASIYMALLIGANVSLVLHVAGVV